MSQQLTVADAIKCAELVERFNSIAPKSISLEAEQGFAIQILKNNDYLMRVAKETPQSLQQAVINVAAIGLSLNPALKQAYLISRTVKTSANGKTVYQSRVFLDPSYVGLIRLATNSGSIEWVQANLVYSNDKFTYTGPGEKPIHEFNPFAKKEDRGAFQGAYCVAKTKTGDHLTTMMSEEKILDIRDRSEAWKAFNSGKAKIGGPWQSDFEEMTKKTVIRNAFKTWPMSDENNRMADAVHISNENEGFEPLISSPNTGKYTAEQKNFLDQCIEQGDHWGLYKFRESLIDGDYSSQGSNIWTSLVHSFEKGKKGYYGQIIMDLTKKGEQQRQEISDRLFSAVKNNHDEEIKEIIIDSDDEELLLYMRGFDNESILIVDEVKKGLS